MKVFIKLFKYPYEEPYGSEGGDNVLIKQLKVEEKQHQELAALRKGLTSCFTDMSNFLLPHPGRHVATNPNFRGNLNQIDEEFIKHIKVFSTLLVNQFDCDNFTFHFNRI